MNDWQAACLWQVWLMGYEAAGGATPWTLDAPPLLEEGIDTDAGETRCPRCRARIQVWYGDSGYPVVRDASGERHTHQSRRWITGLPLGPQERHTRRRAPRSRSPQAQRRSGL